MKANPSAPRNEHQPARLRPIARIAKGDANLAPMDKDHLVLLQMFVYANRVAGGHVLHPDRKATRAEGLRIDFDPNRLATLKHPGLALTAGEHRVRVAVALAALVSMLAGGLFEYNFGDSEFLMLLLVFVTLPFAADRDGGLP